MISITWNRVSWTILCIAAFEVLFWVNPLLSAPSKAIVTSSERAGALAYFQLTNQLGATNAAVQMATQRQLLALDAKVMEQRLQKEFQLQRDFAFAQQTSSARKSGVSLLGGLALTGGVLLLSYARGSGLAAARDRSGGGRAGSSTGGQSGSSNKKKRESSSVLKGGMAPAVAAVGTVAAAGVVVAVRRGAGSTSALGGMARRYGMRSGAQQTMRAYSSKTMAPMAESAAQVKGGTPVAQMTGEQARYDILKPGIAAKVSGGAKQSPAVGELSAAQVKAMSVDELSALSDGALVELVQSGRLPPHTLEARLDDLVRAVSVRRQALGTDFAAALDALPFENYAYENVVGACAENVLGYVPVPVGVAGPVLMDGELVHLPMATTEGCLIASTHRGCKAISESGGADTILSNDGMTRAPAVQMPSAARAGKLMAWLAEPANVQTLRDAFQSTTRFGKLVEVDATIAGRTVYVRFRATTGDAMGMNMISKGVECALAAMREAFPDADVLALSGNMCTDKKPSAVNWINGRGKSVVAEAVIKRDIVESVLKTNVDSLVQLNVSKNLVGSAMAGSIGGFNAHASNIVTAMYIATGQDPAQNVESSNCITLMEKDGEDLRISVTMPSIECAAIGGGTHLPAQAASLALMGCKGAHAETPGLNAQKFARSVAVATLAGELSLMSALAAGHLVRSHMELNRKK